MHTNGIMIGSFEPLHLGHMRHILYASSRVNTLHIIIVPHPTPSPQFKITLQDKARWLQIACRDLPFIQIHTSEDVNLPPYEKISSNQQHRHRPADINKIKTVLQQTINKLDITDTSELFIHSECQLATSLSLAADSTDINSDLGLILTTLPQLSQISPNSHQATKTFDTNAIHQNPLAHWDVIHPEARGDYTRTIAIVGGESSGKTTLVHKLANYYGASYALEMGRLYVETDLGGSEVGLQYSDYAPIALDHAQAVRDAKHQAPAPITIVDTDFVTTQAFCEVYESRTHHFVAACIDEFRFDATLFLANNTPWVADGMRSLGSKSARKRFEDKLSEIFARHHIKPHRISSPDYYERYQQALQYIDNTVLAVNQ